MGLHVDNWSLDNWKIQHIRNHNSAKYNFMIDLPLITTVKFGENQTSGFLQPRQNDGQVGGR